MTKRKGAISQSRRRAVLLRDGYICAYCGTRGGENMAVDHVTPLISGGTNDPLNLVAACYVCNARKGSRPLTDELREYLWRKGQEPWPVFGR